MLPEQRVRDVGVVPVRRQIEIQRVLREPVGEGDPKVRKCWLYSSGEGDWRVEVCVWVER